MAKHRFSSLIIAAAVATLATPSIQAAEQKQTVNYNDLDLSTKDGRATFKSRIAEAVRNVCTFPGSQAAFERHDRFKCEARAKTDAMSKAKKAIAAYRGNVRVARD